MDDYPERRPKKRWTTTLLEIFVLLSAIAVAGFLGWFIGRGDVKDSRVLSTQLKEAQATIREMRVERVELQNELELVKTGGVEKVETDVDRLLSQKEEEWKRKINEIRIEAELAKVQRVSELERELRMLKMEERMKQQQLTGDDSGVAQEVAPGLTPRARQVCAKILEWEGLPEEEFAAAKERLVRDLGAKSLTRIKFGNGSAFVGSDDLDALKIATADTQEYSLLLAVGFADTGGDAELNRELGSLRAQNAAVALRGLLRRGQMVESVYLGETERFGERAENRTVEVWELRR